MIKKLTFLTLALNLLALPVFAADRNGNGVGDEHEIRMPLELERTDAMIAIVDIGTAAVADYISRLAALGYAVNPIPVDSDLETLLNYNLVILPVGHGDVPTYSTFDALKDDYRSYVEVGGGLWVGQPNPWQHSGGTADITWVPYELTLWGEYNENDCPAWLTDVQHCITAGYYDANFSFPADTVLNLGIQWEILVVGLMSGNPGVLTSEYGAGKILVEFGHPSLLAICPIDDTALRQYVECTVGSNSVATEELSLDEVKALYQ